MDTTLLLLHTLCHALLSFHYIHTYLLTYLCYVSHWGRIYSEVSCVWFQDFCFENFMLCKPYNIGEKYIRMLCQGVFVTFCLVKFDVDDVTLWTFRKAVQMLPMYLFCTEFRTLTAPQPFLFYLFIWVTNKNWIENISTYLLTYLSTYLYVSTANLWNVRSMKSLALKNPSLYVMVDM